MATSSPLPLPTAFTAAQRLFELQGDGPLPEFLVHTWSLREALNRCWQLQLSVLSPDAGIDPQSLLGLRARLLTRLADGDAVHARAGMVLDAISVGGDGGLAGYRLKIGPWLALLLHGLRSAVWQERRVAQIVDSVFVRYAQHAAWRMSTRCIGRHLIDLPASFVLNSEWSAEIDGVKVDMRPMTKTMFDLSLDAYKKKLASTKLPLNGLPFLRSIVDIERGVVFDRGASDASTGRASRQLEAWGWDNGFKFSASVAAFDGTFPEDASSKFHREQGSDVSQKLVELQTVFSRLRGRAETDIPTAPGFCIANGFVAGPPRENEESYVSFHLEGAPDLWFNVASLPETVKEDQRLLERTAQVEREMKASGTQTIRKGRVEFGGSAFDEWLFKGRTPDRVSGTMFYLLGNEAKPGLAHPFIRVQLFNGFRIPAPERTAEEAAQLKDLERATLSEAEAVGVWDRIAPTVRLRPGAF